MPEGGQDAQHAVPPIVRAPTFENFTNLKEYIVTTGGSPFSRLRLEAEARAMTNQGQRYIKEGQKQYSSHDINYALQNLFNAKTGADRERWISALPSTLAKEARATLKSKALIAELRQEYPEKYRRENHIWQTALDLDELFETAGESAGLCDRDFHFFDQETTRNEISRLQNEGKLSPRGAEGQFALRRALLYGDVRLIGALDTQFMAKVEELAPWINVRNESNPKAPSYTPLPLAIINRALES